MREQVVGGGGSRGRGGAAAERGGRLRGEREFLRLLPPAGGHVHLSWCAPARVPHRHPSLARSPARPLPLEPPPPTTCSLIHKSSHTSLIRPPPPPRPPSRARARASRP